MKDEISEPVEGKVNNGPATAPTQVAVRSQETAAADSSPGLHLGLHRWPPSADVSASAGNHPQAILQAVASVAKTGPVTSPAILLSVDNETLEREAKRPRVPAPDSVTFGSSCAAEAAASRLADAAPPLPSVSAPSMSVQRSRSFSPPVFEAVSTRSGAIATTSVLSASQRSLAAPSSSKETRKSIFAIDISEAAASTRGDARGALTAAAEAARSEGARLRTKIQADTDPGDDIRTEVATAKAEALAEAGVHEMNAHLNPEKKEEVFEALTKRTYDAAALTTAFELDKWFTATPKVALREHLVFFFERFFMNLASAEFGEKDVIAFQKEVGLSVTSDRWTGRACARVAQCNGLPADGQVVHTVFQGRLKSWFAGHEDALRVHVVPDTESGWGLAGHGCGVWLMGNSGVGKDNVLNLVNYWHQTLSLSFPQRPCLTELDIGRLSYTGLLETLEEGKSQSGNVHWLTWTNSEVSQCFSGEKNGLGERDICQLAEGTAVGKRVKGTKVRKKAAFWFLMGAQREIFHDIFKSHTNGRLRGFSTNIDEAEVGERQYYAIRHPLKARSSSVFLGLPGVFWGSLDFSWGSPGDLLGSPGVSCGFPEGEGS